MGPDIQVYPAVGTLCGILHLKYSVVMSIAVSQTVKKWRFSLGLGYMVQSNYCHDINREISDTDKYHNMVNVCKEQW